MVTVGDESTCVSLTAKDLRDCDLARPKRRPWPKRQPTLTGHQDVASWYRRKRFGVCVREDQAVSAERIQVWGSAGRDVREGTKALVVGTDVILTQTVDDHNDKIHWLPPSEIKCLRRSGFGIDSGNVSTRSRTQGA